VSIVVIYAQKAINLVQRSFQRFLERFQDFRRRGNVLPIETATGAWPTPNTLAYRKFVGASVSKSRTATKFSTKRTPTVLEKAAATLERTDFPKEGFPGGHKKTPRNLDRLPSETSTSGILAGYPALTLTLRALKLALCQNTTILPLIVAYRPAVKSTSKRLFFGSDWEYPMEATGGLLANTGMVPRRSTLQPSTAQFLPLGIPAPPTTLA